MINFKFLSWCLKVRTGLVRPRSWELRGSPKSKQKEPVYMTKKIVPRPDASEEHLAIIGSLREAIDVPAKLHLLIDLRSSYKPHREWSRAP